MRGETRLFVGNLPNDIREREVDDLFFKFGRIRDISVRTPRDKPGYAFVEFDDDRDADDAQYDRDNYQYAGRRIRVEFASRDGGRGRDGSGRGGARDNERDRERGAPPKNKTDFRLVVDGLPGNAGWQDLKDFARNAGGDVTFTKVANGKGEIEYSNAGDMEDAVAKLDNTEFKDRNGAAVVVSVRLMNEGAAGGGAPPASSSRGRGRSGSCDRSRSRDGGDGGADESGRDARGRSSSISMPRGDDANDDEKTAAVDEEENGRSTGRRL